ncbi:carbamate kinase [Brevibacterium linens]|uniref:Carbamate kinase n=1 Tax=Brevibacterium linens TaxID=1703 RepID=A0A0B8ZXT1_BRELN|nr:carbamate kinase [Brevibacterium linens]KHS51071.1 Carbamate kinase [Brevibacterium linens]
MRVLVALGGNALTGPDGDPSPSAQQRAIAAAAVHLADLTAAGHELVITHGNGPQVGNILRKNELSAHELPPVSLDWCGAQTQGTIGFTIVSALERELAARGLENKVAAVVTRTVVDPDDPAFADPVKPIGSYQDADFAAEMTALGQTWKDFGDKGWRRVVASPYPAEILETSMVSFLADSGWTVVAGGGGGIPVVPTDGGCVGVSAVIDKDLSAAKLAASVRADLLIIATDVPCAVADFGTPDARDVGAVTVDELKALRATGTFASGSMGPKVDALLDFVDNGGSRAVITELSLLSSAVSGTVGTSVSSRGRARSEGRLAADARGSRSDQ